MIYIILFQIQQNEIILMLNEKVNSVQTNKLLLITLLISRDTNCSQGMYYCIFTLLFSHDSSKSRSYLASSFVVCAVFQLKKNISSHNNYY